MLRKSTTILTLSIITTLLFSSAIFADGKIYTNGAMRFTINDQGSITIVEYFGDDKQVKVPMAIGPYVVEYIEEGAFADKEIKKIELPDTIKEIPSTAFKNIDSIDIDYYDKDDEIVEMEENPIIYIESGKTEPINIPVEQPKQEIQNTEQQTPIQEEVSSEEITVGDIEHEEGFNEEVVDAFDIVESNNETIDEINNNTTEVEINQTTQNTTIINNSSNTSSIIIGIIVVGIIAIVLIKFINNKKIQK